MAVAISAVEQDFYPPRILVSITGLTLTDDVIVYRVISAQRTELRAGSVQDIADTSFLVLDAELPFGVPVTYLAVVNSVTEYSTSATTYILGDGGDDTKVVFTDAVSGAGAEAIIVAWPDKQYAPQSAVFVVGGRQLAVSTGGVGMYTADIELVFEATTSLDNFYTLLNTATEGVIQFRADTSESDYWTVQRITESRYSNDWDDERRTVLISVAQVESWAAALEARGFTYQDVADYYGASGHYTDVSDDYATYLAVAQGDFS